MSDDPILAALARLEAGVTGLDTRLAGVETGVAKLEARMASVEAEQTRLREQINDKLDDILDKLAAVRAETDTTRGFVLYAMQDSLTLSQRITKLEEEMRRRQ